MELQQQLQSNQNISVTQQQLLAVLNDRGYKKYPDFLAFGLKFLMNFSKQAENTYLCKTLLFVIPMWYLGLSIESHNGQSSEVKLHYYTKGLKFLDIFGVSKKWQTEIDFLKTKIY